MTDFVPQWKLSKDIEYRIFNKMDSLKLISIIIMKFIKNTGTRIHTEV